jgi:predicted metal-dependent phosphoesterase TrpH
MSDHLRMKFDLHIHSHRSYDSVASIKHIINRAQQQQLSGIAITDHEILTSDDVINMAEDHNIWIIRGIEAKTDIGDIIALFISKDLKSRKACTLIDEIHDQGGIAILSHPFKYMKQIDYYPTAVIDKLDAIEVVNSRWDDMRLHPGNPKVSRLLSAVRGRSAGSDSHFPFEVGRAYWTTSRLASQEELKQSIRSNSGAAICDSFSRWLDGASQFVKFAKRPTSRQLARMMYWSSRRVMFGKRTIPNE